MSVLRRILLIASPLLLSACTEAEEAKTVPAENTQVTETVQTVGTATYNEVSIKAHFEMIGVQVESITPTAIPGIVEVATTGGLVYSDLNGENFIAGTLFSFNENGQPVDVLAERQAPLNAEKIESFSDDMIVYKADNEKYVVTVFTDTTCGYCVRLHSQMKGYNDLGITVRYLAYPRQGPQGDVADQMAEIWCSEDPAKAMSDVKISRNFDEKIDDLALCQQKISDQYMLGRELGISGTPAVFLPDGKLVAGYMPPAGLYQRLQELN